ncbi:hypothetical protein [Streptacidiphilus sp. EB129]|uniref:hypothetical protein n=1 Tax=Streptacidiphilus sp. EB129 TaxID=3156262 RepID=UPI0035188B3E
MPGSVTIGHMHPSVNLGHDDAARLAHVMAHLSTMLEAPGPNRISDAQLTALCEGESGNRPELAAWARRLATHLHSHT